MTMTRERTAAKIGRSMNIREKFMRPAQLSERPDRRAGCLPERPSRSIRAGAQGAAHDHPIEWNEAVGDFAKASVETSRGDEAALCDIPCTMIMTNLRDWSLPMASSGIRSVLKALRGL